MLGMSFKAVAFDIDGTLYSDIRIKIKSIPFLFRNYRLVTAFSRIRKNMRKEITGELSPEELMSAEASLLAEELNCTVKEASELRDKIIYGEWEKYFKNFRIYPDVRDSLIKLKNSGLKLAVLSDFPVGKKLEYFNLADLFDVVLGFPESGNLKPSPVPFLKIAEQLEIQPDKILYIGNRLDYDVIGAESAGLKGALIGPPGRKAPGDVLVYKDYEDMAERIVSEVGK